MKVFEHFMKAVYKNKVSIIIYIIIFVIVIVSATSDKKDEIYKENNIDIVMDDRAHDEVSKAIKKYYKDDEITYKSMTEADKELAISLAEATIIVTINKDAEDLIFDNPKAAVSVHSVDDTSGRNAEYNLSQYIGYLKHYKLDVDKAMDMMNTSANVIMEDKKETTVDLNYFFRFSAFILTAMLMFNIALVNASLNEKNFYMRTVASPIKNSSYNFQIFLGQAIVSLVLIVLMLLVMVLVIPKMKEHILITFLNFLVYVVSILGLANLLTAITDKKTALVGIVNVFAMFLAVTGGAFIPMEILPTRMIKIGKAMPFYYFGANAGVYDIDATYIKNLLVMLAMGAVYFAISAVIFKKKRRRD